MLLWRAKNRRRRIREPLEPDVTVRSRRPWLRVAQVVVTVGLIGWLFRQVEWPRLVALLASLRWDFVVLAVLFLLLCHLINIVRWRFLLQQPAGFGTLLVFYGAGLFSNNFLPTGIGGDGVRAALLSRVVAPGRAIVSVALDRGIGLIALSALLAAGWWAGLPPGLDLGGERVAALGAILPAALLAAGALVVLAALVWRQSPRVRATLRGWLARWGERWQPPRWTLGQWSRCLAGGYGLSVCSHLCIVAATWALLQAMRIEVAPAAAIWLVITTSVSLLVPVAVNGIGVVEGVYVVVLGSYGVTASVGLGFALLMRAVGLLVSLAGGLALLQRRVPVFEIKDRATSKSAE
jgi:uncharacterized membrane protein YbhN (UPF0104 family)